MVSPWMANGNVLSYTRKNPEANRLRLVSLTEQLASVNSDTRCLAVDRRSKWFKVPSSDEFGAREHSRGVSSVSWLLGVTPY